jgi:uncharacterized protein YqjF (DUF2071 family)
MTTAANPSGPGACPYVVDKPIMVQHWDLLTFLHWSFEPAEVQRLLPDGLQVEVAEGRAWVGLVPFFMRVGLPTGSSLPWASRFCETNVRTYVTDGHGRSGIWFFSLDAARLGAVAVARASYRLPYFWSHMRLDHRGSTIDYHCRRRLPGPYHATSRVHVDIGPRFQAGELSALDHFLTARWLLFSVSGARRRHALAQHEPWELYRATVTHWRDELVAAAGLPAPRMPPVVHYSPGVRVLIGRPLTSA